MLAPTQWLLQRCMLLASGQILRHETQPHPKGKEQEVPPCLPDRSAHSLALLYDRLAWGSWLRFPAGMGRFPWVLIVVRAA